MARELDRKKGTGSFKSYSKKNFENFLVDAAAIAIANRAEIIGIQTGNSDPSKPKRSIPWSKFSFLGTRYRHSPSCSHNPGET